MPGNKRLKKLLMSHGVQRNDADSFIRSYRKIQQSGAVELFRGLMEPYVRPIQPVVRAVPVHTLQVTVRFDDHEIYTVPRDDMEHLMRERLARQLASAILDSGYVYTDHTRDLHGARIRAKVMVVSPQEYPYG